jgi:hypothetical protein
MSEPNLSRRNFFRKTGEFALAASTFSLLLAACGGLDNANNTGETYDQKIARLKKEATKSEIPNEARELQQKIAQATQSLPQDVREVIVLHNGEYFTTSGKKVTGSELEAVKGNTNLKPLTIIPGGIGGNLLNQLTETTAYVVLVNAVGTTPLAKVKTVAHNINVVVNEIYIDKDKIAPGARLLLTPQGTILGTAQLREFTPNNQATELYTEFRGIVLTN